MLKQRILTALILVPLTLAILLYAPAPWFLVITALMTLLGAWEWTNLMEVKSSAGRALYLTLMLVALSTSLFIQVTAIFALAFLWWLVAMGLILSYPKGSACWGKGYFIRRLMGFFTLVPCWAAINFIRNQDEGIYVLLFLLVLIFGGADTFAYFAGKKWGRDKLAPTVSPGKSRQGVWGALVGSAFVTLGALWLCQMPYSTWPWALLLSLVTVIFSIVGDLFESMLKRQVGVKDSGTLLPGHGGILDRIDSLTAAAPIFVCGAILFGQFLG